MIVKHGIAVSPGVAIGQAFVLGAENFRVPQRCVSVDAVETEVERFRTGLENACAEIGMHETLAKERLGDQYAAIFGAHLQMARDPKLASEIEELIRERNFSPEFASVKVLRRYARELQSLGDSYLAERAADMFDLEKRLLRHLMGERREELAHLTEPVLVLAHNLTPSETAGLDRKYVLGFATEVGGRTSHTAILAGALEIPAIVGIGKFLSELSGSEHVIIDGDHGKVIINPDAETLKSYKTSRLKAKKFTERLQSLAGVTPQTKDGERIWLMGNIEFPEEAAHCSELGADGIGLYRTEFLYLGLTTERTEADHYQAYKTVVEAFGDKPVIIRTLDLGADKVDSAMASLHGPDANPELGLRSIRLSLANKPLFVKQLRAVLRVAVLGNVRVMFPLISSLIELRQAKMLLADVVEDLEDEGIEFCRDIQVGMMVEVPAAALMADEFAREVDFLSIGTNDLIQYTLAADRSNPSVSQFYNSADPSIIRILNMVIQAGRRHDVPVTVCGQMSSDLKFIPLLIGLGLRQISVTPHVIPEIKEVLRNLTIAQAEDIAAHVQSLELARDVESYLRGELYKLCPELIR